MLEETIVGFLVYGISLSLDTDESEACSVVASELKRAGFSPARLHFRIYKKSVDARRKDRVRLVYSVAVSAADNQPLRLPKKLKYSITPLYHHSMKTAQGNTPMTSPPLVVGMGPAGLFCALMLAEAGYAPVIIDRGDCIADRSLAYERFVNFGMQLRMKR